MNIRERHSPSHIRTVVIRAISVLVVLSVGVGGYLYVTRDDNPIPDNIQSQLTFSPFVLPSGSKEYSTSDYTFTTPEEQVQVLSYVIRLQDSTIAVSEYTQPPEFIDIPEYKDRFLTNIAKQYDTVPTANGTIYLGRLSRQNDKQLAVMLERGLLVFMSPDKDLTPSQWRNIGDQLEIQKK